MDTQRERNPRVDFLVDIAYWVVILAIIYVVFKYLLNLLMPFFLAFVFAAVVRPISKALSRETKYVKNEKGERVLVKRRFHMNQNLAGIISVLVLFLVVGGLLTLIMVRLVDTITDLVSALPSMYESSVLPGIERLYGRVLEFSGRFDDSIMEMVESALPNLISSIGSAVTNFSAKLVSWLTSLATRLPNMLLNTIICLIATVFIAIDFDRIKSFIRRNLPEKPLRLAVNVKNSFLDMIWQFIKSYFIIFCITVVEIIVGLLIIGEKKSILIAVLIGVFDAFPIVGSGMILLPWAVITLVSGNVGKGIGLSVIYIVVVVARQIIEPRIVGKHVGLRPIVTLSCMYAGTKLFGGIGLFALPIMAAILVDLNDSGIISFFTRPSEQKHQIAETES